VSSFRRIISSRANAARSTGPTSPSGKLRSSQNARRHNCRSKTLFIPEADAQLQFDQLRNTHLSRFQPRTPAETALVQQMVEARWRLRCVLLDQARIHTAFFASRPPGIPADDYLDLLRVPGYTALLDHEYTQEMRFHRALRHLVKERRKSSCPTIPPINIPANEPTLPFPYAEPVPQTSPDVAPKAKIPTNEATLRFPYTKPAAPRSARCRFGWTPHPPRAG
jgi:hypothetical protein